MKHFFSWKNIFSISLYLFSHASSYAQQGYAAQVNIAKIQHIELSPYAWVSGTVVTRNDSKIASEVSGRLVSLIALGANVKKGDVIAELDDRTLQLNLREEVANVENAKARLTFEQSEVTRNKSLVGRNLVSKTELEETLANRDIAKANLQAAQAKVASIKQNIAYTKLKAPFDGIIATRLSNQGEFVNSGNAIVRIVETANVEASIFAPITAYQYLKNLETINIKSPLGNGNVPIKTLIPVANSQSHLMEVRLNMTSFDWPIGLNMSAAVPTGVQKKVLALSRDALILRRNSMTIFRINNNNIAEQIDVQVGIGEGGLVEVIGDINIGDSIVIRGAERLQPGQTVIIKSNNDALISGKNQGVN